MSKRKYDEMVDLKNLSNWAITPELLYYLFDNLERNSTIIEFGSGTGSIELSKHYNLWSIENNLNFLYKNTLHNIYAPIKKYTKKNLTTMKEKINYKWYDEKTIKNINKHQYSLL